MVPVCVTYPVANHPATGLGDAWERSPFGGVQCRGMGFSPLDSHEGGNSASAFRNHRRGPEGVIQDSGCLQQGQTTIFSTWLDLSLPRLAYCFIPAHRNGTGKVMWGTVR